MSVNADGRLKSRSAGLRVWLADPALLADPVQQATCAELLTPDEIEKASRYHFVADQYASQLGRALLRMALANASGKPPLSFQFAAASNGKPYLEEGCQASFNLAHTRDLVACVVVAAHPGEGCFACEVGIDVEAKTRAGQVLHVLPTVCSAAELAQLRTLPTDAQEDRALTLWTLKEAFVKADGRGMALGMNRVEFLFAADGSVALKVADQLPCERGRWRFGWFDAAEHRVALCMKNAGRMEEELWLVQKAFGRVDKRILSMCWNECEL